MARVSPRARAEEEEAKERQKVDLRAGAMYVAKSTTPRTVLFRGLTKTRSTHYALSR